MIKKYTKKQLDFLFDLKKKGYTVENIVKEFEERFKIKKSHDAIKSIIKAKKGNYDLSSSKTPQQLLNEEIKGNIYQAFQDFVRKLNYVPTSSEFSSNTGFKTTTIKTNFGDYSKLENLVREENPDLFKNIIDETHFTDEMFEDLELEIKKYKKFVITSAVTGCKPFEEGLNSLKNFCKRNKAKLLIQPCSDPAHIRNHKYNFSLHHSLPKESIVFRDLMLNENIFLSSIKLGAKQINPLTGLTGLSKHGSCILASPKQTLIHTASSNKKGIPRALMTTGAITLPDYRPKRYMSERTAYIAEEEHKFGAIIVEVKDSKVFFYRRVQIDPKTGSFCDLDTKYNPNGSTQRIRAELVQQPDWHVGSTDPSFKKAAKEIVSLVKPDYMTLEDFFDGASINPHEKYNIVEKSKKAKKGELSLETELRNCSKEIEDLSTWKVKELVFKYGNHEDFLKRWLSSAEYKDDPVNHYEGVCLAKAYLEGEMPFEYAMTKRYPVKTKKPLIFLGINDSFKVNGIENGVHGHLGSGGKRNPGMAGLEAYGPCNTGHNHSAAILRDVCRVGTATHPQLSYNDGASGWTQTLLIQHFDKSRQLITVINGEWRLK